MEAVVGSVIENRYYTASKEFSLTVIDQGAGILFQITGGEQIKRSVRKIFLPNIIGALDILGLGLWTGREVCDGVYFENGKRLGYVRIRVRKGDNEKVFVEIPNFEAGALSRFLLKNLGDFFSYSYLNIHIRAERKEDVISFGVKIGSAVKEVVFDIGSAGRFTSAIRTAVLGRLTHRRKITGRKGYVIVGDYFKTEDPKLQNQVDEAVAKLREYCDKEGIFPAPFIRKTLTEKNIPFKTYITFRIGEGFQEEDRAYMFLPLPHAWGIAECLSKLMV
jgi:hypothetical protein